MLFQVQIKVMPLKDLLDPQGKAVLGGLHNLGMNGVQDVRVGKHITLQIEAANEAAAATIAQQQSKKLSSWSRTKIYTTCTLIKL